MTITIGADPELLIVNPDTLNIQRADQFLSERMNAKVGCDGCSTVAELRPSPATDAFGLTKNIKRLITNAQHKVGNNVLVSGSGYFNDSYGNSGYPIGGHIHFSMYPTVNLIKSFDVMSIFLMQLEQKKPFKARQKSSYGKLGATERKSYGFEYRTMPSWLSTPEQSVNTLAAFHTIALEFERDSNEAANAWTAIYEDMADNDADTLRVMYSSHSVRYFKAWNDAIIAAIKATSVYQHDTNGYRAALDATINRVQHGHKYGTVVCSKAWGIGPKRPTRARKHAILTASHDDNVREIVAAITNNAGHAAPVMVYGRIDDAQLDITTQGLTYDEAESLASLAEQAGFTCGHERVISAERAIGIKRSVRMDPVKQQLITNVLNGWLGNITTTSADGD